MAQLWSLRFFGDHSGRFHIVDNIGLEIYSIKLIFEFEVVHNFLSIDLPPSGNVIAYNSNSDRGWNDPPTLAFAAAGASSTTAPRKRIDLRKRVAHNCVSGGAVLNNCKSKSLYFWKRVYLTRVQELMTMLRTI